MSENALQVEWLTGAVLHGKYRVGPRLGEGGMGAVYLAEHVRIQHRHVVNVTDFGVDRVAGHDVAYLVMEQLHGETLEAVLEMRRRLPQPGLPLASVTHGTGSTATQVGESIGTPAYMSPQQCVGDDVDQRNDIYSLGVVVYQMLTGALPFRGDTMALLRQHFVAEIPPFPADAR